MSSHDGRKRGSRRLVVLGMHRSGTSATTALINSLGAFVGRDDELTGSGPENPRGFFEREDVRRLCDGVLQSVGADWWKVSNFDSSFVSPATASELGKDISSIVAKLDAHGTWVVKEPRLCLLLPLFLPYLGEPTIVFVARNPLEVATSLHRRNGIPRNVGLALWEAYCVSALHHSDRLPRVIVDYRNLVEDPVQEAQSLCRKLSELGTVGLSLPSSPAIDPSLHRERCTDTDFAKLASNSQRVLWAAISTGDAVGCPRSVSPSVRAILQDFEEWLLRPDQTMKLRARFLTSTSGRDSSAPFQDSGDRQEGFERQSGASKAEQKDLARASEREEPARIPIGGYDFLDFGCSAGGSMDFARQVLGGQRGLGIDLSATKVSQSIAKGNDAMVGDITRCEFAGNVGFVLMSHFLEHLPSIDQVRRCVEVGVSCARDFVLIQQPYFDADGYLLEHGLKLAWSDWHGHRTHISSTQLHTIAAKLWQTQRIKRFLIGRRMRIRDSSDHWVHPLQSPPDQLAWSDEQHAPKSRVQFEFPVFRELFAFIFPADEHACGELLQRYIDTRDAEVLFDSLG